MRKEFNSIKKQNAEDFAEEVLTNVELNKLLKIDSTNLKKESSTLTKAEKLSLEVSVEDLAE